MTRRLVGVGVDVVEVERLARVVARQASVLAHVCTDAELMGGVDALRAAQLWSGKEAVAKSLGTGFWQAGVAWPEIEIHRDGRVGLSGGALDVAGACVVALDFSVAAGRMMAVALRWRTG